MIYTDTLQTCIMLVGSIILTVFGKPEFKSSTESAFPCAPRYTRAGIKVRPPKDPERLLLGSWELLSRRPDGAQICLDMRCLNHRIMELEKTLVVI